MAVENIAGPLSSLDYRIRYAIAHRRLVELTYQGRSRLAEPHDYGAQRGIDRLLAYQRQGPARPGMSPQGWRLFDVAKFEAFVVLDETFAGSRADHHDNHHAWDPLYARVK